MVDKALEGVKVLEYASFVAGPYCSKLLADLGADVIKIEKPGSGDEARRRGPFLNDVPHPERSGLFLYLNTNKKGITLDPETPTGKKIFLELVKWADILIEDNPPLKVQGLGLTYDKLKKLNPSLIVTSITPFGQTGPYRDYKAYQLNVFHGAGGGYLTPGGSPNLEREPLKGGGFLDDYACGLSSAIAALGALYARGVSGIGQHIDASRQETAMALDRAEITKYPNEGKSDNRGPQSSIGGMGMSKCKDGHLIIMAMLDRHWQALVKLMGDPDWAKEERFRDMIARTEHRAEINRYTSEWFMEHTKHEIYHEGQSLGVPIGLVYDTEEIVNSEQYKAREFFIEVDHPETGKIEYPSAAYRFSGTPLSVERPAPLMGQHNNEIYSGLLGYPKEEIVRLREAGII